MAIADGDFAKKENYRKMVTNLEIEAVFVSQRERSSRTGLTNAEREAVDQWGIDIADIENAALVDIVWLQNSRRAVISMKEWMDGPWLYKLRQHMTADDWSRTFAWRIRRRLRHAIRRKESEQYQRTTRTRYDESVSHHSRL